MVDRLVDNIQVVELGNRNYHPTPFSLNAGGRLYRVREKISARAAPCLILAASRESGWLMLPIRWQRWMNSSSADENTAWGRYVTRSGMISAPTRASRRNWLRRPSMVTITSCPTVTLPKLPVSFTGRWPGTVIRGVANMSQGSTPLHAMWLSGPWWGLCQRTHGRPTPRRQPGRLKWQGQAWHYSPAQLGGLRRPVSFPQRLCSQPPLRSKWSSRANAERTYLLPC